MTALIPRDSNRRCASRNSGYRECAGGALSTIAMIVYPLLSTALDEPSAFEEVHHRTPDSQSSARSGLAADAGAVGLGEAAAPEVRSVTP